jgi:asparagine synthase (glutamine-hydrolysing)
LREQRNDRFEYIEQGARELTGLPPVTQAQFFDLMFYLPNDMLVKVDRASMAHGLEVRVPFLSRTIADLAFRIPEEIRFTSDCEKRVLRELVAQYFGKELAYRNKRGFGLPLRKWMLAAATPARESEILASEYVQSQVLAADGIRKLFSAIRSGGGKWKADRSEELFALLCWDAWWKKYQI